MNFGDSGLRKNARFFLYAIVFAVQFRHCLFDIHRFESRTIPFSLYSIQNGSHIVAEKDTNAHQITFVYHSCSTFKFMDDTRLHSVVYSLNGTKSNAKNILYEKKNPKTETDCAELEGEFNATHQYNNSGILLHTRSIQRKKKTPK